MSENICHTNLLEAHYVWKYISYHYPKPYTRDLFWEYEDGLFSYLLVHPGDFGFSSSVDCAVSACMSASASSPPRTACTMPSTDCSVPTNPTWLLSPPPSGPPLDHWRHHWRRPPASPRKLQSWNNLQFQSARAQAHLTNIHTALRLCNQKRREFVCHPH
jgi:hypothetical protein